MAVEFNDYADFEEPDIDIKSDPKLLNSACELMTAPFTSFKKINSSRKTSARSASPGNTICSNLAYHHLRIFAEADYFVIDELRDMAEANFHNAFQELLFRELKAASAWDHTPRLSFGMVMRELYSRRANYRKLKEIALELVMNNLPELRRTVLKSPLEGCFFMGSHPDFAADLAWMLMEKVFPTEYGDRFYPSLLPQQFSSWGRYVREQRIEDQGTVLR
ncbi:hypothetical protein N7462_011358 [Penicillium macrosclerotiorum]|uniref:uncharacterized protein n=1 Tax=Penicillium macrosclerotiorum TaxID=303699 RepID=UPI002548A2A1|nr:uncharacterized protein N7462_011358 [Penicillium macrosclerotiorum]KAJ5666949.1 hypothetical protein N7462_011358 [Penicillium macrosclerotiorum]